MKTGLFLTSLLVLVGMSSAWGQERTLDHSDHVKGANGISVVGGIGDRTALYRIGYYYQFANKFFVKGDFFHVFTRTEKVQGFTLTRYGLDIAPFYQVVSYKGLLFLNIYMGITSAWNTLQVDKGNFSYEDTMKFGFFGGAEVEVRLYKKLMGVLTGDGRYMLGNSFGNWRVYGTIGLRYTF